MIQEVAHQTAGAWELAKGIMLTLTTAGVLFTVKTIFGLRDALRELTVIVCGSDGQNGLRSSVRHHTERLDTIENRNRELDAISKRERELYTGPEKRHQASRRDRDTHPFSDTEGSR